MATVVDLLRQLAHDIAPDGDVLRGPLTLPPRQVSPYALDIQDGPLAHWSAAFGRPTTAQHALAIAATRARETVAFVGGDRLPDEDLLLLVLAHLRNPQTTALWLVPDAVAAQRAAKVIRQLEARTPVRWLVLAEAPARPPFVQLIVATYDEMHERLLPFADRAWRWFWRGLRTIAMSDLERANGLPGAHLRWLLRRAQRLSEHQLLLVGASAPLTEGGIIFQSLWGRACRTVDSTVGPAEATLVMLWRCEDRYAMLDRLAKLLRQRGLSIAVVGRNERDDQVLRARFGTQGVAALDSGARASIALVSGIPAEAGAREALVRCGYRMVVMLAADDPHEIYYFEDMDQVFTNPPMLLAPDDNPFIANYHLQCAAAEHPLAPNEIERWHVAERAEALVNKQRLRVLNDGAMQPSDATIDSGTRLQAATSNDTFVAVRDPLGTTIASLRPAVADWRGLPGATWAGDLVVAHRSDDPAQIDLAVDERRRLAYAVATYRITPRTKLETRAATIADQTITITHWNAEIRQRVEGLEEHTVDRPPVRPRINTPLEARWHAHGCAIPLPVVPPNAPGAGWSLKEALSLQTYSASEDVVATYDAATQSLWLIETAPGGTGVVSWMVEHLEDLLLLAREIARGCETNALLRTLARSERAWLEPLLDPNAQPESVPHPVPASLETPTQRPETTPAPTPARASGPSEQAPAPIRSRIYPIAKSATPPASSIRQPSVAETDESSYAVAPQPTAEETEVVGAATSQQPEEQDDTFEHAMVAEEYRPFRQNEPVMSSDTSTSRIYDAPDAFDLDDEQEDTGSFVEVEHPQPLTEHAALSPRAAAEATETYEPQGVPVASPHTPLAAQLSSDDVADEPTWTIQDDDDADEIEDIAWEPNPAAQLPPEDTTSTIPPLGRETPALNAAREPRYERQPRPAPQRRQDERPTQPTRNTANERDPQRRPEQQPRAARPAPPTNQRRFDNRAQNERRNEPKPVDRTAPAQPNRPPTFGDPSSGRSARAAENERYQRPPERSAVPSKPKEVEEPADVGSMIARMRRLREEREQTQAHNAAPTPAPKPAEDVPLRFRSGQYVRCVPYGEGIVQSSRVVDGREQLMVTFPDIGALELDPDINFIRVIDAPPPERETDDE